MVIYKAQATLITQCRKKDPAAIFKNPFDTFFSRSKERDFARFLSCSVGLVLL